MISKITKKNDYVFNHVYNNKIPLLKKCIYFDNKIILHIFNTQTYAIKKMTTQELEITCIIGNQNDYQQYVSILKHHIVEKEIANIEKIDEELLNIRRFYLLKKKYILLNYAFDSIFKQKILKVVKYILNQSIYSQELYQTKSTKKKIAPILFKIENQYYFLFIIPSIPQIEGFNVTCLQKKIQIYYGDQKSLLVKMHEIKSNQKIQHIDYQENDIELFLTFILKNLKKLALNEKLQVEKMIYQFIKDEIIKNIKYILPYI